MATSETQASTDMSQIEFSFSYDGPAMKQHKMEVQDLAPALLAIGELLKQANHVVNGEQSRVSVFVKADFENKCFQIHFEVLQTYGREILALLASAQVQNAKNILDWAMAAWELLKALKGQKPKEEITIQEGDNKGDVILTIPGNNNKITINNNAYKISGDEVFRKATIRALEPLERPGVEKAEYKREGTTFTFSRADATDIVASCKPGDPDEIEPQPLTAWLSVYSPKFDPQAKTWQFNMGKQKITVDISRTSIIEDTLREGAAYVGDRHKMEMEMKQDKTGRATYTAKRILQTRRGHRQIALPTSNGEGDG